MPRTRLLRSLSAAPSASSALASSSCVIGVQRFDSFEKAQEFAADLARWQSRSERLASGRFVIHADRF